MLDFDNDFMRAYQSAVCDERIRRKWEIYMCREMSRETLTRQISSAFDRLDVKRQGFIPQLEFEVIKGSLIIRAHVVCVCVR